MAWQALLVSACVLFWPLVLSPHALFCQQFRELTGSLWLCSFLCVECPPLLPSWWVLSLHLQTDQIQPRFPQGGQGRDWPGWRVWISGTTPKRSSLDLCFPLRGVSLTTADPRVLASEAQSTLLPHHPSPQPQCNPGPRPDWSSWSSGSLFREADIIRKVHGTTRFSLSLATMMGLPVWLLTLLQAGSLG